MVAAAVPLPQPASTRGFTLLEVLVALTVLGLLFFDLVQDSHLVLLGRDRQAKLLAATEDLDAVDRTLRRLIVHVQPGSKWEKLVFDGTARSATFTSIVPKPTLDSSGQRADVELVVDDRHRLLLLWTVHLHVVRIGPPPPVVRTEILDGVDRLELAYWNAASGGGWTSIWHDAVPPGLVRIRIIFADPSRGRWPDILAAPILGPA